ncbi:hypothetical protein HUU51_03235 [Candidatus Gracilibacteria bacterium]|nr:hypothetical protein [Candidatus Gracilibacteria bacterium]
MNNTKGLKEDISDRKIIESVLRSFGIDSSQAVNYVLSKNGDDFLDGKDDGESNGEESENGEHYSWEEIILKGLNFDKDALSLISMNPIIARKFYLIFFSHIDINELDEKQKIKIIEQIRNTNVSEGDFRKVLNFISNERECLTQEDPREVNKSGALDIRKLSPFMLDNFTSFPRVIKLRNGRFISIQKSSETPNSTKVFTIRFGIKKDNVAFPIYTGICNLITGSGSYNLTDLLGIKGKTVFAEDLNELKLYLSNFYNENPNLKLPEIKRGKTGKIGDLTIDFINKLKGGFYKAQIFDAGINDKGHKVLFIQSKDTNDGVFAQLEMNLFSQNGKNIIYVGALGKDESREKFIKAIPGLLTRLRDILKEFDDSGEIEIWSFKADRRGKEGVMRKDNISQVINRYKPKK